MTDVKKNVSDVVIVGNGDMFQLLCKAMQVLGGCVVQVTTQQGDNVAEALTYVPGVKIAEDNNNGRKLVPLGLSDDQ